MKKFFTIAIIYLLPLCLLTYLLTNAFIPKKPNFYDKIAQGQPISILVVGDSIGGGSGSTKPEFNFANRLKTALQKKYSVTATIVNVSMGGNTTYAPLIRVFKLPQERNFDLVILCCGENDHISTLGRYYEALVRNVKTKYPNAEIISTLQSSQKVYTGKIKTIQSIAQHYNIPTADTIAPFTNGENGEYNTLTADGIHPNNKGYAIYAKVLENLIATNIYKKQAFRLPLIRKLPIPLFTDSLNYVCFQTFPTNVLTRTENTFTGKITFSKNSSIGMDVYNIRGTNSYKLFINETQIALRRTNWKYNKKHFITELKEIIVTGECQVSISFGTQNQADSFKGFYVTYPPPSKKSHTSCDKSQLIENPFKANN